MTARAAIDWVYRDGKAIKPGELVSAEPGVMPIYRVLALEGGRARLRELAGGAERLSSLDGFPWKALLPAGN